MNQPRLTLIAALDINGVIGAGGGMPWHLPEDLRWFKQNTRGKPIVMGRKTFDAIGRALPQRHNFVMTRRHDLNTAGATIVGDLDEAIARATPAEELMVIGGAEIYALALPRASRLLLTRVEFEYDGDTWFPEIDWQDWALTADQPRAGSGQAPAYRFMTYDRRAG